MIDYGYGVKLGPIDKKDCERLRAWRNDPQIYKWCRQNDLISDVQQLQWFERQAHDPTIKMFMVRYREDAVGVCGLTSIDLYNRRAEFSLYVDPALHRKGIGRKALQTLLAYGFDALGLNSIWGESFTDNPAMKMFEEIGMHKDGIRPEFYFKEGRFIDAHLFSITAQEWVK